MATAIVGCTGTGPVAPGGAGSDLSSPAAPSPAVSSPATSAPAATPAATPQGSGAASPAPAPSDAVPVLDQPWATVELTDVATGGTFRLADLAGKTVIIETMAIWCSNCLSQQRHVYDALVELDPARVAFVVIDVNPNETEAALAQYRESNGFTGTYVVATRDLARALASEFGDQVLNPPATPMLLIGSDGRVTLTDYGSKSPERIVELAREHGA